MCRVCVDSSKVVAKVGSTCNFDSKSNQFEPLLFKLKKECKTVVKPWKDIQTNCKFGSGILLLLFYCVFNLNLN